MMVRRRRAVQLLHAFSHLVQAAEVGDLVYLSDKRKWLGGLKSIHSEYGEPHDEEGVVYINRDHLDHGLFDEGKSLIAEKEM